MELERLLLVLVIWIIWRILTNKQKAAPKKAGSPPVLTQDGSETGESLQAAASLPSPSVSVTEAEKQPSEPETVMPLPTAMPGRRARCRMMGPDRPFLQQAVVWAEILAAPVGLRDEF